ncbi:MAG: 2Fe-2S iron-sulfur cluster-binding protein [Nitrososphaerales archaeon]|jgi:carbon-monoxide dehydrogenase small subunit
MRECVVKVNGQTRRAMIKDNELLLDLLREELEVRSVKAACWRGECGLCTVLLNGALVKSCLVLAVEADGGDVTTVEGITENGELAPIQKAFVEHGAAQCGFCTPAWILTTHQLLKTNPHPSEKELTEAVAGLVCRCGTYNQIREAVADASKAYEGARRAPLQKG